VKLESMVGRLGLDAPSPLLKQAPTVLMYALAIVMCIVFPGEVLAHPTSMLIGSITMAVATLLAAIMTFVPSWHRYRHIIPAIDFLAIGAILHTTGPSISVFAALLVLPVIWYAANEGRRHVFYAAGGTAVALLYPLLAGAGATTSAPNLLRAFFSSCVLMIAAIVVNEISRHARLRLDTARELADQRSGALEESMAHAKELRASEARLRSAEELFRGLWQSITEQSVIGTDVTGRIDAWNPGAERMLGLPRQAVRNKRHIDDFHVAEELENRARELSYPAGATVLNPGFSALVEPARLGSADVRDWTYVKPDGSHIPVQLSVTPRLNDDGETIGYLFVAYDVTKEREVAKLKDEFVGLISHELRTPLSSILGYLELMRDDDEAELSESQLQYLGVAERNAHRLLRLVGDLLFTAQVESGKFNLDQRCQDLAPIVSASVESARPHATSMGIMLRATVPTGSHVHVDAVRLGQACDNLISNAIKFTPAGGTVTVSLDDSSPHAVVTVSDTGIGISPDELDKLFTKFFRASTATRNAVPGVGLGLAITKAIVKAHGGDMDVQSEEGVGTTFSLSVPRLAEPELV
jgi:signal transduction histidine kinase